MRSAVQFLLFQAVWFAAVAGAAGGNVWIGPAATLALVVVHLARFVPSGERARELSYVLAVGALGTLADSLLAAIGATAYPSSAASWPYALVPPWISALWIAFATLPRVSLAWLAGRPLVAAVFGAVGGPLSYLAGARLGAVAVADDPWRTWGWLALEYALATPLLLAISNSCTRWGRPAALSA